jgi:hypothetical protein
MSAAAVPLCIGNYVPVTMMLNDLAQRINDDNKLTITHDVLWVRTYTVRR